MEHLPSPRMGQQELPPTSSQAGRHKHPGEVGKCCDPLSGWAHSSSPATSAGLWVSNGSQPMAELPRDRMDQDQAPPQPQQLARLPAGFRRTKWISEDPPLQPTREGF